MVNCGAAMYIAPIGAVNACDPQGAYDEAISFAAGHQQSYGLEAAGVLAGAVAAAFQPDITIDRIVDISYGLAKDGTRDAIAAIAETAQKLRDKGAGFDEVVETFHNTIAPFSPMGDDLNHTAKRAGTPSKGYQPSRFLSIEELPLALGFAIISGGDFRQSILDGINSGRDTDSIGVMAGAILGAMHGESVIEPEDAAQLNTANRLDIATETDTFIATAQKILSQDQNNADTLRGQRMGLLSKE